MMTRPRAIAPKEFQGNPALLQKLKAKATPEACRPWKSITPEVVDKFLII